MRVALTGGIGSGKTTASRLLAERGAVVIDADAIAREVVEPGEPALDEIRAAFGDDILDPEGRLDRSRLAGIVFADEAARERLNAITHPRIAERSAQLWEAAPEGAVVVYDMPLLVENGLTDGWDAIVVVDAPDDVRLERLVQRGLAYEDARARMAAQASRDERLAVATHVVDNSGSLAATVDQVDRLWATLTSGA